jgi:hypothetical protein
MLSHLNHLTTKFTYFNWFVPRQLLNSWPTEFLCVRETKSIVCSTMTITVSAWPHHHVETILWPNHYYSDEPHHACHRPEIIIGKSINYIYWKLWTRSTAPSRGITYPARTCAARGKVIGSVLPFVYMSVHNHQNRQIWIPGNLGIWATCKYNKSVEIVEKLASLCFKSFGKAHKHCKCCVFIGHAYWLDPLKAMCFLLMRTTYNATLVIGRQLQALQI